MPASHRVTTSDGPSARDRAPAPEPSARRSGDPTGSSADGGRRGQTTLDFAVGVSLFLSVMLFVFAFVPGILQPFNLSGEQDTVLSERIASDLSQGALGDASTPYVLESSCAVSFFEEGSAPPGHCTYTGTDLEDRIDAGRYANVNVSIEGTFASGREFACWDASAPNQPLVGASAGGCNPDGSDDQVLTVGGAPPVANDATVTSRRVVSLHQRNVTMKVVVW